MFFRKAALLAAGLLACVSTAFASADGEWTLAYPPRAASFAAAAVAGDHLYVACGVGGLLQDAWSFSLSTQLWSPLWGPGLRPQIRRGHTLIHDPSRGTLILFGGYRQGDLSSDVWILDPASPAPWTAWAPAGTAPSARMEHAAVYDPVRDRMLVFGGWDGQRLNDVWALSLGGTPTWSPVTTQGVPPSPRHSHGAVYDPAGDRMLVFGGWDGAARDDLWALSLSGTPTWTLLSAAGPGGRKDAAMALDPDGGRLIVIGGADGDGVRSDVWTYSFTSGWSVVAAAGTSPPGRRDAVAAYDPTAGRVVMYGGFDGTQVLTDTWALALAPSPAWTRLGRNVYPTTRRANLTELDAANDRLVMATPQPWVLPLAGASDWQALDVQGPMPSGESVAAILDPARNRMVACGGKNALGTETFDSLRVLSLSAPAHWTTIFPSGPTPVARHSFTFIRDPSRDRAILYGGDISGATDSETLGDLWTLDLATLEWTEIDALSAPGTRTYQASVLDSDRDRILVHGGIRVISASETERLDDLWALDLESLTWVELATSAAGPGTRYLHALVVDPLRDRLLLSGGLVENLPYETADVWELPLSGPPVWNELHPAGVPPPGMLGETVVFDASRDRMVVHDDAQGLHALGFGGEQVVVPTPQPLDVLVSRVVPNPARGGVSVRLTLADDAFVSATVHDLAGRRIVTLGSGPLPAGVHELGWDARIGSRKAPPGIYFLEVRVGGTARVRRFAVLR